MLTAINFAHSYSFLHTRFARIKITGITGMGITEMERV
ncbi:Protein of unknown function [Pyronema omphalodes CBS 100304]|uniref:Uncharacterized protein n=1 Tax=Pyronema omphalodes (strain CBS 100304) TaxID=1076935 RepID=U4LUT2_PYROM|nr:Protein of unknown function [Pyronema omphalodes CBS 100304]